MLLLQFMQHRLHTAAWTKTINQTQSNHVLHNKKVRKQANHQKIQIYLYSALLLVCMGSSCTRSNSTSFGVDRRKRSYIYISYPHHVRNSDFSFPPAHQHRKKNSAAFGPFSFFVCCFFGGIFFFFFQKKVNIHLSHCVKQHSETFFKGLQKGKLHRQQGLTLDCSQEDENL